MEIDKRMILRHFSHCGDHSRARLLHNAACYLVRMILRDHEFDDMQQLIDFCADPDNLRPWLPSETDRIIFSEGLVEGLGDIVVSRIFDDIEDVEAARSCVG